MKTKQKKKEIMKRWKHLRWTPTKKDLAWMVRHLALIDRERDKSKPIFVWSGSFGAIAIDFETKTATPLVNDMSVNDNCFRSLLVFELVGWNVDLSGHSATVVGKKPIIDLPQNTDHNHNLHKEAPGNDRMFRLVEQVIEVNRLSKATGHLLFSEQVITKPGEDFDFNKLEAVHPDNEEEAYKKFISRGIGKALHETYFKDEDKD